MNKRKIINDPIYGLINFPYDLLYDLIDHPHFQRLRRISQMGLSNYVYPGATHSRFAHALGALHLMSSALKTLRAKGIEITDEECLAACIAILLHDVGHGPFSHALETIIIEKSHEEISLDLMHELDVQYSKQLNMAIAIFKGSYVKKFLTQLVSSQLDMDRMDYLTRDSYYSGVAEGVIGYKRIIAMLNVADNELVVEEKGIYSIEKFLVARHIMYWQVYLHKASVCVEQMLRCYITRLKQLLREELIPSDNSCLHKNLLNAKYDPAIYLEMFTQLDDIDIFAELKNHALRRDKVLSILANAILHRKLFKAHLNEQEFGETDLHKIQNRLQSQYNLNAEEANALIIKGVESTLAYNIKSDEILILRKDGKIVPASELMGLNIQNQGKTCFFLIHPK